MKNNFFKNKIVVITDGASLLGKALATEIALLKGDVILIGNNKDELSKIVKEISSLKKKTGRVFAVTGDLSTKEGCELAIRDAKKIAGTYEILINNSSLSVFGKFEDEKPETIKKIIDTNITGTILMTKYSLPILRSNKKPGIINISNFYGKVGMPYFSVYTSTKFAISGFTESLQREYAGENLKIMSVYLAGIKGENVLKKEQELSKLGFIFDEATSAALKIIEAYNDQQKSLVLGKKERNLAFWNGFRKKSVDEKIKRIKPKLLSSIS